MAIAVVLNSASGGFVTAIYSMVGLTHYLTYFLTLVAAIIAWRAGRIPAPPQGVFNLGRWLVPLAVIGGLWTLAVIATLSIPDENRAAALTTVVVLIIGFAGAWSRCAGG